MLRRLARHGSKGPGLYFGWTRGAVAPGPVCDSLVKENSVSETASLDRYNQLLCKCSGVGIRLDISRMRFDAGYLRQMEPAMQSAFAAMAELEAGTIANPDEQRRVGHYWLRAPELAPDGLGAQITACRQRVEAFAHAVHKKETQPPSANRFTDVLLIGIGGSALGPQLLSDALSGLGGKRPPLAKALPNANLTGRAC